MEIIDQIKNALSLKEIARQGSCFVLGDKKPVLAVEVSNSRYRRDERPEFMLAIWRMEEGKELAENYRAKYVVAVSFPGECLVYIHDERPLIRKSAMSEQALAFSGYAGVSTAEAKKIAMSVFIPVQYFIPISELKAKLFEPECEEFEPEMEEFNG